jgi:multicomponent Na+:H+ antiporter subunit G
VTRHDLGEIALLVGSLLILIAAVGVVRLPDTLTRMHALSKASTLGVAIALLGAAVARTTINDITSLLFATILQAATNPVASTVLIQATYYTEAIANRVDTVDELAESVAGGPT